MVYLFQFLQKLVDVALYFRDGIKDGIGGCFHLHKFMPGMIVFIHDREEAFLEMHLLGDEEVTIGEKRTDLLINFLNGSLCFIREDDFAMLLVIAGIAV